MECKAAAASTREGQATVKLVMVACQSPLGRAGDYFHDLSSENLKLEPQPLTQLRATVKHCQPIQIDYLDLVKSALRTNPMLLPTVTRSLTNPREGAY